MIITLLCYSELTNIEGYTPAMMAVLARMKEKSLMEEIDEADSEEEYFYKFPEPKKSANNKPRRKTGLKRKSTTASLYSPSKTRISKVLQIQSKFVFVFITVSNRFVLFR